MKSTATFSIATLILSYAFFGITLAQGTGNTKELNRVKLSTSTEMEVISSISEYKPGDVLGRHFHHGVESGYFIQGGMIQPFGGTPIMIPNGTPIMNERNIPHGGFKVLGDTTLKIYTVHIVDNGKPLYDWVEK